MPQTYKVLGQSFITPNSVQNVYVTGATSSAIVSAIWVYNQGTISGGSNVSIDLILRPINEAIADKHFIVTDTNLEAYDTNVYNYAITMPPNTILAANLKYRTGQTFPPTANDFIGATAFGVEIT